MLRLERLCRSWNRASLATRFGLAGGLVLLVFALLVGSLVAQRIQQIVVRNTATAAALYMDSFLHLRPRIGVLLNIDSDHLDYFTSTRWPSAPEA